MTTAKSLASQMRSVVATDAEFEAAFAVARVSQHYLARYYLRSLEMQKRSVSDPEWIPNESTVVNLEHVLPESTLENWPNVDPELAEANYRRIGNLALLQAKQNTLIGNAAFADKRQTLKDSTYILTEEIGRKNEWGIREIAKRQASLAKLAVLTWPIDVT